MYVAFVTLSVCIDNFFVISSGVILKYVSYRGSQP